MVCSKWRKINDVNHFYCRFMIGTRLPDYCGVCCVAETGRAVMLIPTGERWSELSSARDANCAGLYKSSLGISVTKVGHVAVFASWSLTVCIVLH